MDAIDVWASVHILFSTLLSYFPTMKPRPHPVIAAFVMTDQAASWTTKPSPHVDLDLWSFTEEDEDVQLYVELDVAFSNGLHLCPVSLF